MQLPPGTLQKGKNAVHAIQGLAVFVAWALTIAVFTQPGNSDGRTRFYFVLVSGNPLCSGLYPSSIRLLSVSYTISAFHRFSNRLLSIFHLSSLLVVSIFHPSSILSSNLAHRKPR